MNVQKRIHELMVERNWSVYRLSKESGLSSSTLTNMIKRNNAPTLSTLQDICRAFGLTLPQFFSEGNCFELTDEQIELFKKWNRLTPEQKQALLALMDSMI